jgi:hypothetical protein
LIASLRAALVEQVLEQGGLRLVPWGRVGQVDHVAHPHLGVTRVVLHGGVLRVQLGDGVGDATLDGLGDPAAVQRHPVGERLGWFVGAGERLGDHCAAVRAGGGAGVLDGGDHRRGAHVRFLTQPRDEVRHPLRVELGDLMDQSHEPLVANTGALVEGVLTDEVRDAEREQFGAGVLDEADAALVGARLNTGEGTGRTLRTGHCGGLRELAHGVIHLSVWSWGH